MGRASVGKSLLASAQVQQAGAVCLSDGRSQVRNDLEARGTAFWTRLSLQQGNVSAPSLLAQHLGKVSDERYDSTGVQSNAILTSCNVDVAGADHILTAKDPAHWCLLAHQSNSKVRDTAL